MAFFGGMPIPVQFLIAFVVVLGLIGATAWSVRRLGGSRAVGGTLRGRQPRLAVVDYAGVDGRRRLVLVRRDNVEHLVMIGGPTDIVVEANIVRTGVPARVATVIDPLPRAIPMTDGAAVNGSANGPANTAWPAQSEVSSRTQRDTFFSEELGISRNRPHVSPRTQTVVPRPDARREPRQENSQEARPDSRQESRLSSPQPAAEAFQSADQALAEMAQQLEAALRKPVAKADRNDAREQRPAAMPRPVVEPATPADAAGPSPLPAVPFSAPVPVRGNAAEGMRSDAKPQASGKPPYEEDLEQEMASLLGRSSAK